MITITLYWWFAPLALFIASWAFACIADDVEYGNWSVFWMAVGTFTPLGMVIGHFLG